MSDEHKDIAYKDNDIESGVRELYRLFKENCYVYNQQFTDTVVKEVEAQSENKKLSQICEGIIRIIKSENSNNKI